MHKTIEYKGSAVAEPYKREPIEWNRMATIVATIVVLFFFTRSAPFPASIFWELTVARDYDSAFSGVLFPETMALYVADSSVSLLGLKAIYHVAYFILCSLFCIWIFKNKEPLPGLVGLSVFAFSMQSFLNLRMLLTSIFILGILFILDNNLMRKKFGVIFIPIFAAASGLGLNSLLLLSLVMSHVLCNRENKLSIILCSVLGGLFFPEGLVASIDSDSIFNMNFISPADMEILYVLSGIYLVVSLFLLERLSSADLPNLIFYAITAFFALMVPATTPVFAMIGFFMVIKFFSDQKPLPLNFQMLGLLAITAMVYLYLFINPFGIKLNPSVRNQLGKDLAPLMEGYIDKMPIESHNLGELSWKGIIRYDQEKFRQLYNKDDLMLVRNSHDEYRVVSSRQEPGTPLEF